MVEVPTVMGVAGANVSPRVDVDHTNGVEPQPEDVPDWAALTSVTSKEPSFSPPRETTLDDVTSVLRSFDIVVLGVRAVEIPLSATSARQLGASGRGCGVGMFMGHDRVSTTEGDADPGWSGCSTTSPGQSLDGRRSCFS
jgi:hypothetical protein